MNSELLTAMEAGFKVWLERARLSDAGKRSVGDTSWLGKVVEASIVVGKAAYAVDAEDPESIAKMSSKLGAMAMDSDLEWLTAVEEAKAPSQRRCLLHRTERRMSTSDTSSLISQYVDCWPWARNMCMESVLSNPMRESTRCRLSEVAPLGAPALDRARHGQESLRAGKIESIHSFATVRAARLRSGESLGSPQVADRVNGEVLELSLATLGQARGYLALQRMMSRKVAQNEGGKAWDMFARGVLMGGAIGDELASKALDALSEAKKWSEAALRALVSARGCQILRELSAGNESSGAGQEAWLEKALGLCVELAKDPTSGYALRECEKTAIDMRVLTMDSESIAGVVDLLGNPKDAAEHAAAMGYRVQAAMRYERAPGWMLADAARLHGIAAGFGPQALAESRESMCALLATMGAVGDERIGRLIARSGDDGLAGALATKELAAKACLGEEGLRAAEMSGRLLSVLAGASFGSQSLNNAAREVAAEIDLAKAQYLSLIESAILSESIGKSSGLIKKTRARL